MNAIPQADLAWQEAELEQASWPLDGHRGQALPVSCRLLLNGHIGRPSPPDSDLTFPPESYGIRLLDVAPDGFMEAYARGVRKRK